jgi:uncharacterized protein
MAAIWVISDLHLSFGVPDKSMDVFGKGWANHADQVKQNWIAHIQPEDLVLIPGDISWAMHLEDALPDLQWIHQLPGIKLLLKGNHDYWWSSISKVEKILPSSIHLIQNNSFNWGEVAIGGGRLWDTPEYSFRDYTDYVENPRARVLLPSEENRSDDHKIFQRELIRLEMSLKSLNPSSKVRIAMTHYPPIGADLKPSSASALLEKYGINICVFGHLHNLKTNPSFGERGGVRYVFASCDCIRFMPIKIWEGISPKLTLN